MRPTKKKKKTRRGRKKIYDDTRPGEDFYDNYLLGRLSGAWTAFSPAGDSEGTVHFRDLAWYGLENDPAMTSPFLRFVHMSPRGSIVFEYADGEEACARIDGDTLTWGDGYVYYRIERQTDDENGGGTLTRGALPEGPPPWAHSNPEDDVRRVIGQVQAMKEALSLTWSLSPGGARSFLGEPGRSCVDRSIAGAIIPAEHTCDMSSVVSAAATTTTVVHLRKLNGEELPSLTPLQSADCRNGDGEAIALPEVLAESDEEKKADAAIVDTGGDTHIKITGRDCDADYDCDYRYGTGIMDENMAYRSGDGGSSPDGNEPSPVARALYDWHLVDFGANFAIDSNRVAWLRHHYEYVKHWWSLGIGIGIG